MKYISYLVFVAVLFSSCKENSVHPIEEPPEFPELNYAFPDLSYFGLDSQTPAKMPSANYSEAAGYLIGMSFTLMTVQLYSDLISTIDFDNWDYKNGIWTWNYEMNTEGIFIKYKITAQVSGDEYIWNVYSSYNMQEFQAEETKIMEARVKDTGDEGTWTIYALFRMENEPDPIIVTDWRKIDDETWELTSTINYLQYQLVIDYLKDEDVNSISITQPGSTEIIFIAWNSSTKVGSIQYGTDEKTRKCWDADYQDIACSEIDI